jgi:hypothetical protein
MGKTKIESGMKKDQEIEDSLSSAGNAENQVVKYDEARLKENYNIGMKKVDPADIRPPTILLIQKSSDLTLFQDTGGKTPTIGQFFHNGRMAIYDNFDCYFIFAAKSKYVDKRKQEDGEKDQYRAIGAMADDLSLFSMVFRSSSLYTLSPLFTSVTGLKRPLFSIKCHVETKELTGDKGTWTVPVCRITGPESDGVKLEELEMMARKFDAMASNEVQGGDEEIPPDPVSMPEGF